MNLSSIAVATTLLLVTFSGSAYAAKDAGLGHDYRTFHSNGEIDYGKIGDSYSADLVMYLAGNQFMVMEDLIKDFQSKNPDIKTVYVETIPPGQIFKKQFLDYLATTDAQGTYAGYGFIPANSEELKLKPLKAK